MHFAKHSFRHGLLAALNSWDKNRPGLTREHYPTQDSQSPREDANSGQTYEIDPKHLRFQVENLSRVEGLIIPRTGVSTLHSEKQLHQRTMASTEKIFRLWVTGIFLS